MDNENLVRLQEWSGYQSHSCCSSHCKPLSTETRCNVDWFNEKKKHRVASILSQQGVQTLLEQFYSNHKLKLFWKLHPEENMIEVVSKTINAEGTHSVFHLS